MRIWVLIKEHHENVVIHESSASSRAIWEPTGMRRQIGARGVGSRLVLIGSLDSFFSSVLALDPKAGIPCASASGERA